MKALFSRQRKKSVEVKNKMHDAVKYGLVIGSVYVLARSLSKDKILTDQNIRNGAIGAGAGVLGGPKLEDLLKNNKKQAGYVTAGAIAGYAIERMVSNGTLKKALEIGKEKLVSQSKND